MELTSRKNPIIKEYRALLTDKKARREKGMFLLEGARLCKEAAISGCELSEYAFVTPRSAEKYPEAVELLRQFCKIITVYEDIAGFLSDTKTPQGIFVGVRSLDKILKLSKIDSGDRFIILENLQDSGNIGTIIRTCDALGVRNIILTPDCADVFSPKTIRSTMGSVFRVNIYIEQLAPAVRLLKEKGITIYAAELNEDADRLGEFQFEKGCAVMIGNEGNGLTKEAIALSDHSVYIPMEGAESLNASVAASIIMWEMTHPGK